MKGLPQPKIVGKKTHFFFFCKIFVVFRSHGILSSDIAVLAFSKVRFWDMLLTPQTVERVKKKRGAHLSRSTTRQDMSANIVLLSRSTVAPPTFL